MYALHRHPDNFKNPDAFVPNRFLDGSEDNLDTKFLGFSKGPRGKFGDWVLPQDDHSIRSLPYHSSRILFVEYYQIVLESTLQC